MTRLEEIADLFISSYVKDHPIMLYSLDNELDEFLEMYNLRNPSAINEILQEYEQSNKKRMVDTQLTQQVIASGQKALEKESYEISDSSYIHKGSLNSSMLIYLQSRPDGYSLIYNLRLLIAFDESVIVRNLHELIEADQHDLYMPNDWIYHRDSNIKDILNYVRNYYDRLRKEDENEWLPSKL